MLSVKSYEAITGTIAHEIAHLELANAYAKPLIGLDFNDPVINRFCNMWSDYVINSFLVAKGYSPSLLSKVWEINEGHSSVLVYHLFQGKPCTRNERRNRLGNLLHDLTTFSYLAKDSRLKKFTSSAFEETINSARPILSDNSVRRAVKSVSALEKVMVREWIENVLGIYESQK